MQPFVPPVARRLSGKFDKRRAAGTFIFILLWGPSLLIARLLEVLPENGDPMLLPMILAHNFTNLIFVIVFGIMFGQ